MTTETIEAIQDQETQTSAVLDIVAERLARNEALLRKHAIGAVAIGLIPMPGVDFVALTALQLNLLRKLSAEYGVPFTEDIGKKAVGSLVASYTPVALAMPVASLLKAVPILGQALGGLAMSAVSGASTYAVGKVFIQHFESGGTFLNFDPVAVREYYRTQFQKGQEIVKAAKPETTQTTV
jgi:uncharacterized protein (DUF697 family)